MRYTSLFFLVFVLFACKTNHSLNKAPSGQHKLDLSTTQKLVLLDSVQAASTILVDKTDHFFENITITDMTIQMQKVYPEEVKRSTVLKDYKAYLQKDVSNFNTLDVIFLETIFKEVFEISEQLGMGIFPKNLQLIKIKGKHYGPSVYYTRENVIVIPEDVLLKPDYNSFLDVMFHELFHVYSRLHPEKRAKLYELIGFEAIGNPRDLVMQPDLKTRILLNPDGVNYSQKIELKTADTTITAIPVIVSTEDRYTPEKPSFFSYLNFQLYEIKSVTGGKYQVMSKEKGESTLDLADLPDFFKQIKDNTQYIIHPDEILADNFVILALWKKDKQHIEQFSEGGQALVKAMGKVISQP